LLQSNEDLRGYIDRLLGGVTGALWALMALAFVVASLGVVNTLTMNVAEQAREFGVLRAVGMRRGQLRRVVLAQALITGAVSLVPGTVVGVGLAYLLNRSTGLLFGAEMAFRVDPGLVLGCTGMALAFGTLAASLPARPAARMSVLDALR
jgi:putative ABC transport system permease protein